MLLLSRQSGHADVGSAGLCAHICLCLSLLLLLRTTYCRTLQFQVAGVTVRVVQDPELTRQETGSYLWEEASEYLINFILKEFGGDVKGRRFVDLGCGCGSVGNALALLGGDVTLTDVDELRSNVQANIEANAAAIAEAGGCATFSTLDWTDANRENILRDAGPFDMVVGSELMYAAVLLGDTHAPLISTIQAAMTASAQSDPPVKCVGMLAGEYHFVSATRAGAPVDRVPQHSVHEPNATHPCAVVSTAVASTVVALLLAGI